MTPSTAALLCRARDFTEALPAAARCVNEQGRPSNVAKLWALRWRRRWGGRVGKLRAGDVTTSEDSRQKASTFLIVIVFCMSE